MITARGDLAWKGGFPARRPVVTACCVVVQELERPDFKNAQKKRFRSSDGGPWARSARGDRACHCLLFFIISAATGLYTTKSLQANNLRVVQTHDLIVAIGQLQSEMQDAETGQRGYLLTGDERYLEPFEQAKVQIVSRLAALDSLVAQSPFQSRRLGDLKAHIKPSSTSWSARST